jgi:hypothetical protein
MTVKENNNFLGGEEQPRKQQLPWRSRVFPWRLSPSRKLIYLAAVDSQENFFPWRLQHFLGSLAN